jgi:PDDEXK-like uncharacterized protein DUF3799
MNYNDTKAVNSSLLKECLKSPFHGYKYLNSKHEPTPSMELGTLVHALVLKPEDGIKDFYVLEKGVRTNDTHRSEANGRTMVREQTVSEAYAIARSVRACPAAMQYLDGAETEKEIITKATDGTALKGRIDGIKGTTLIELKTSNDLYARDFTSTIIRYDYHLQCAFYSELIRLEGKGVDKIVIIQVTTEEPYLCSVFELSQEFIGAGMRRINKAFPIAKALLEGWQPEQTKEVLKLELPEWAKEML